MAEMFAQSKRIQLLQKHAQYRNRFLNDDQLILIIKKNEVNITSTKNNPSIGSSLIFKLYTLQSSIKRIQIYKLTVQYVIDFIKLIIWKTK
jgi:hypothetical protein